MKSILHIFGCMERGGAEMRTLDLMRYLPPEQRYSFEFCSLSGQRGVLDDEIRKLGGQVHYCNLRAFSFPFLFNKLLRERRFDVVHSHVHYSSGYILMLAHLSGVRGRIAHFRNTGDGQLPTFPRRRQTELMKFLLNLHATSILAVGEGAMEHSWGRGWQNDPRCKVIPNGLDTAPFEKYPDPVGVRKEFGFPTNCLLIVHVGRMVKEKNHIRLAAVFGTLLARQQNVYALIVGKENEAIKKAIIDKLREHKIVDRVCFAGVRNDIPRVLMGSNLLLFPSLREGLPGVVLEACAAGTPVLASELPGTRELTGVFSGLRTLSLDVTDSVWIHMAEEMLKTPVNQEQRKNALAHFRGTPYNIKQCLSSHMLAWTGKH
jgi:glycosyltransferase involved in cell wall biosynthesis